jgi:hypothetical protein
MLQLMTGAVLGINTHESFEQPYENTLLISVFDQNFFCDNLNRNISEYKEFTGSDIYFPGDNFAEIDFSRDTEISENILGWLKLLANQR